MEWLVTILVFSAVLNGALLLAWFSRRDGVEFRVIIRSEGFDRTVVVPSGGHFVFDLECDDGDEDWWERGERPLGEPG